MIIVKIDGAYLRRILKLFGSFQYLTVFICEVCSDTMEKKKFPNTSILSLITQQVDEGDKLLFVYLKPVPDFYTREQIYWYEAAGKDGRSSILWPKLSIRQWVACGRDSQLRKILDKILQVKKLEIDKVVINMTIPEYSIEPDDSNRKRSRSDVRTDFLKLHDLTFIPQELYQRENLQLMSGYKKKTAEIKTFFPVGFFEDGFIHRNLEKNVFGVIETRTPYLTFHGVRSSSEKGVGTNTIVGFYQKVFGAQKYTAIVRDESGEELGLGNVDNESGFFKVTLRKPNKSGSVEIHLDTDVEAAIDYHLIQDIQVTGHIADTTYTDSYGRSFMITPDMRKRPTSISPVTWQHNVFATSLEANSKLADSFKQVFDYLGPKIVVADPYFIGNFKQDEVTNVITITHCQQALIAALIHSAVEKGIVQFTILGCSRATNQLDADSVGPLGKIEVMIERYEKLFKRAIEENRLKKILTPSSIIFKRAASDFHNRYWFSIKESNGFEVLDKCVVVTNSVGNINEVDLIPITDDIQRRQIVLRYSGLYKNANQLIAI